MTVCTKIGNLSNSYPLIRMVHVYFILNIEIRCGIKVIRSGRFIIGTWYLFVTKFIIAMTNPSVIIYSVLLNVFVLACVIGFLKCSRLFKNNIK